MEFLSKGSLAGGLGGAMSKVGAGAASAGDRAAMQWDRSFKRTFGSMSNSMQSLSTMFAGEALFDGIAKAGRGAFDLIKVGLVDMNAQVEEMRIGLGTIFTANGVTDSLNSGMDQAATRLAQMRKDAAVLPGEFKELASIFQTILAPGLNKGMSVDHIQKMATNAMAYGTAIGLRAPVIGRELAALLSGQARGQNILAQRLPGLSLHGSEAAKFNASSNEEQTKRLDKSLGMSGGKEGAAMDQALVAYGKSWVGIMTSIKSNLKEFAGLATTGLFERLKTEFGKLNAWMDANRTEWMSWASAISGFFTHVFDVVMAKAKALEPILTRIGTFLNKRYTGENGNDPHESIRRDASIAGAGMLGMSAASSMAPAAMEAAGSLVGALAKLTASNPEVGLAAIVAMAGAMVSLSAAALLVGGAFEALADDLSFVHAEAAAAMNQLGENFHSIKRVSQLIWAEVKEPLANLSALLGTSLLQAAVLASEALSSFLTVLLMFAHKVRVLADLVGLGWHNDPIMRPKKEAETALGFSAKRPMDKPTVVNNHTTHVGRIEIKVVSNQDPNRIAKLVYDIQQEAVRNPTRTETSRTQYYRDR